MFTAILLPYKVDMLTLQTRACRRQEETEHFSMSGTFKSYIPRTFSFGFIWLFSC